MSLLDRILDRTVLFSFDRTGFERHRRSFRAGDLEVDLTGRSCLVTGANSGIGKATARGLAERGATVWMLCRSRERSVAARDEIRAATGNAAVHLETLDLADHHSIHQTAERFAGRPVDVLIHNAGLLPDKLPPHRFLERPVLVGPPRGADPPRLVEPGAEGRVRKALATACRLAGVAEDWGL